MSDHPTPELEALIIDALAGDLDEVGRARLDAAIATDSTIADLLEEQSAVTSSLSSDVDGLTEIEAARMRRQVLGAVTPAKAQPTPEPTVRPWVGWAFSAAAILVLIVGGIGFLSQGGDDAALDATQAVAEIEADEGADDRSITEALEGPDESVDEEFGVAESAPADGSDLADDAGGEMVPVAGVMLALCEGDELILEEPLVFDSVDGAVEALSSTARGSFDPRGLEVIGADVLEGDQGAAVVTWVDGAVLAYQAPVELGAGGWEVRSLIVCDR